jgi:hypothetical protein
MRMNITPVGELRGNTYLPFCTSHECGPQAVTWKEGRKVGWKERRKDGLKEGSKEGRKVGKN